MRLETTYIVEHQPNPTGGWYPVQEFEHVGEATKFAKSICNFHGHQTRVVVKSKKIVQCWCPGQPSEAVPEGKD